MKSKILSVLITFAALFAVSQAKAYYSPSTGRWLSRDPLGEPGFEVLRAANTVPRVGQVVSTASLPPGRWINRDPIAEQRGANSYAFVANQPISTFDLLGLDPYGIYRCQIEILVGHGSRIPQPLLIDPCAAASIVSCSAANLSNPRPIPGIDPRPTEDISPAEAAKIAEKDFEAAKSHAQTICQTKKCKCQEVTITAKCDWMDWWQRWSISGEGICGKTETVKCACSK